MPENNLTSLALAVENNKDKAIAETVNRLNSLVTGNNESWNGER